MPASPLRDRPRARPLLVVGTVTALALGLLSPATAGSAPVPLAIADGDGTELSRVHRPVAPGAALTTTQRLESDKWLSAQVLTLDLTEDIRLDYLAPPDVAQRATVGELAAAHDPGNGRTTVAALNADFFDINATDAPLAPGIRNGELTQSGSLGRTQVVGFGTDNAGRLLDILFEGKLTLPDGEETMHSYNAALVPVDGIGVYTPQWGEADRALPVLGSEQVTEVLVEDGAVVSVTEKPGSGRVPENTVALLGREAGSGVLSRLEAGDRVELVYGPRTADGSELPRTAVGGNGLLVRDGEPQNWEGRPNNATAPRTAVGFSEDGREMHILTVDGRQAQSGGTTLTELAILMARLGSHTALNLDGGGSTTLLARDQGGTGTTLVNSPSDGWDRPVPNGLAVTAPAGSGALHGFRVHTTADPARSPTGEAVGGGSPERVFPGLTRKLTADGYDETYAPAGGTPHWSASRPGVGTVSTDGTFTARRPGRTEVLAAGGRARGSTELTVIGELTRLQPTARRVGLADPADQGRFGLLGYDAAGTSAPVEPADVTLEYDRALFDIAAEPERAGFTVTAVTEAATAGLVTATAGGVSTALAVSTGLRDAPVAGFDDAGAWTFSHARAAGSLAPEPDGMDGMALRMRYDFARSTATRAAYATPPEDIPVPGKPHSFSLWVHGDASGARPSLHLLDATGTSQVLRAGPLDHAGWQQVVFALPEDTAYPVAVHRFYLVETRPDAQYSGEIVIDELTARIPPDIELPETSAPADPLITSQAGTAARDWRFAVVSDAGLTARDPDGGPAGAARRTLREVAAAEPDFVIINGDWAGEGSVADLEFARALLEQELGGHLPRIHVPGDREVTDGSPDRWEQVFGDRRTTFDHRGTRFLTLDTSSRTISGGGYAQWRELHDQLEAAAEDRSIGSVIVVGHVPARGTHARPDSRLTDRMDAVLLERLLAEFRESSGKGAAHLGAHAGIFDSYRLRGVPYLLGGHAGQAPAAAPERGGFTGWAMVGVDQVSAGDRARSRSAPHLGLPDWISVQTRPHVDTLVLRGPGQLAAGAAAEFTATVRQEAGGAGPREVPVAHPVSADWSGSAGLHLGDPGNAGPRHSATFDPATGELRALRPGTVTLRVTVSGESRETEIRITG
ncbi:phosphodiester glycosidase family protein [Streptomyces sp. ACA25]|uniref:phosphodiester glycosidase family protein n=1 Tax=Streptomyces sp. ACA25 TaxID=3022596 RepID=UPI00230799F0|nr:phosphodiester glycosidase family protein [Streptomyces sp. ACA25]MDB1088512.1 phosphodiester glycosidase family protein [Streptomyces sp. ACA25]